MRSAWKSFQRQSSLPEHTMGERLTLPGSLEDGRVPLAFSRFSYFASAIILVAIIWGSFAEIRELAVAHGQVAPSGLVKLVQHLEGGLIEDIYVSEGQIVEKGAPLVGLQHNSAESDLSQRRVRVAQLMLQKQRLAALIEDRSPDFGDLIEHYPELAKVQLEVFIKSRESLSKDERTLRSRVTQRKTEIAGLRNELESLERQVVIKQEQLGIRQRLLDEGYASRRSYLDSKSDFENARSRAISVRGQIETGNERLEEAHSELTKMKAEALRAYSEERSKVAAEIAVLQHEVSKHQDRVDRLQIRAPVKGIVQQLVPHAVGEVVKPGDIVAKIVPLDERIVAEVRVEPRDIGHIRVGQPAELRISTFDPNIYGVIIGQVERLSATTFQKDNGDPYFKAIIRLDRSYLGSETNRNLILPGMVVQADIITGAKSLIKYMLKPVYRSLNSAFSER